MLNEKTTFDAIFACSDLLAMTAMVALHKQGIKVPGDVSVIGYDDIQMAPHFNPPLTTVRQPIDQAGRALVDSLVALIGGDTPKPVLLETDLIVRAT